MDGGNPCLSASCLPACLSVQRHFPFNRNLEADAWISSLWSLPIRFPIPKQMSLGSYNRIRHANKYHHRHLLRPLSITHPRAVVVVLWNVLPLLTTTDRLLRRWNWIGDRLLLWKLGVCNKSSTVFWLTSLLGSCFTISIIMWTGGEGICSPGCLPVSPFIIIRTLRPLTRRSAFA